MLRANGGSGRLVITLAGHTRVERAVQIAGGQATEAFDARLTPFAGTAIVSAVLGGTVETSVLRLTLPAGAFSADTAFRLVGIGQQGARRSVACGMVAGGEC